MHTTTINLQEINRHRGAADLVLTSRQAIEPKDALARFRRSVSQWLANTSEGQACWAAHRRGKGYDYDSLVADGVLQDPEFRRFMAANGLTSAGIRWSSSAMLGEGWDSTFAAES